MDRDVAARFFSPPGRRWPEGPDEGVTAEIFGELAPSSRCRGLLPDGEKKQAVPARSNRAKTSPAQPLRCLPHDQLEADIHPRTLGNSGILFCLQYRKQQLARLAADHLRVDPYR